MVHAQAGLAILLKVLRPDHPDIARAYWSLAVAYIYSRDATQAEAMLRKGVAVCMEMDPTHPLRIDMLSTLGRLITTVRKSYGEARILHDLAIAGILERIGRSAGTGNLMRDQLESYQTNFRERVRVGWHLANDP